MVGARPHEKNKRLAIERIILVIKRSRLTTHQISARTGMAKLAINNELNRWRHLFNVEDGGGNLAWYWSLKSEVQEEAIDKAKKGLYAKANRKETKAQTD